MQAKLGTQMDEMNAMLSELASLAARAQQIGCRPTPTSVTDGPLKKRFSGRCMPRRLSLSSSRRRGSRGSLLSMESDDRPEDDLQEHPVVKASPSRDCEMVIVKKRRVLPFRSLIKGVALKVSDDEALLSSNFTAIEKAQIQPFTSFSKQKSELPKVLEVAGKEGRLVRVELDGVKDPDGEDFLVKLRFTDGADEPYYRKVPRTTLSFVPRQD